MFHRIAALVMKELQALLRDPQGRQLLIVPVVLQLVLFPAAATLEVKNNVVAIFNDDTGADSVELVQRIGQAKAFTKVLTIRSDAELVKVMDERRALLAVRFPADFSRRLARGESATMQLIMDGRRSNSGQIAAAYVQEIVEGYQGSMGRTAPISVAASAPVVRHWFNPNLHYIWFILPSLVAIITTTSTLVVTALSVAREREQGTFDQLLVSPLTPAMIMLGKALPAFLVSMTQATIILLAAIVIYRVPFEGSALLLYGSMLCYNLALAGFGLFISSLCHTQQQAFLGVFSFMMPAVLLSGFVSPVENMPGWLQAITWIDPLRHFIVIVKGVFLKDMSAAAVAANAWPLLVIAAATLAAANITFNRRLE